MQNDQIRALIEQGKTVERQSGMLRHTVINLALANGRSVSEQEVQNVVDFVVEYIEHAPALMQQIEEAAANSDTQDDVQPILDATEDYFLTEDDTIPDHLGLVGLLDDAYLTHKLLQAISDRCKAQSGESLLPLEAHEDNAFVRRLIGEPFASILDDRVSATLGGPNVQLRIKQILVVLGKLNLSSGRNSVWGNTRTSDIAVACLGTMSIS